MDSGITFETNSTAWAFLATDGTGYASLALLQAAGKVAWPSGAFDQGIDCLHLIMANCATGNAAAVGSGFYFAINRGPEFAALANDEARDDVAFPVFSGQTFTYPGVNRVDSLIVSCVAVRKTVGTDELSLLAVTG